MRITEMPTPCYVVDEGKLQRNLEILQKVQQDTGCKILLAQKAFSMFAEYPLIGKYLAGTTASSLFEARLGAEEMGGETHIFSPAYKDEEFDAIASLCGHIVFNSFSQLEKYRHRCKNASIGLRLNPECSTQPQEHAIYDPCAPGSRLGVTLSQFRPELLEGSAFSHPLRAKRRRFGENSSGGGGKIRGVFFPDEMDQLRRRPSHHPPGL